MDYVILLACLLSTGASVTTLWFLRTLVRQGLVKPDQRETIQRIAAGTGKPGRPRVRVP